MPDTVEVIQELHDTFMVTDDPKSLENAIKMAEKLLITDGHTLPILNYLLATRDKSSGVLEGVQQDDR